MLAAASVASVGAATTAAAQDLPPIAAVDLYGRFEIADSVVLRALAMKPGDAVPDSAAAAAAVERLKALPGVVAVHLAPVCCDGGTLLYVGLEHAGAAALRFRDAPLGSARLPDEVIAAGERFDRAFQAAIDAGDFAEDDSLGHSLMHFSAARAAQEAFVPLAARHGAALRTVLRESADPAARALAARVLAYSADKRSVVDDLVYAMSDPDETVRNDGMRALGLIAGLAERRPGLGITVPYEPFVGLLRSPIWTDRNKASFALVQLTASRDPALLDTLAREVLPELTRMARWHSLGHALPALVILGRIAGMPEDAILAAAGTGARGAILDSAARR
jgi:hypothetical protein